MFQFGRENSNISNSLFDTKMKSYEKVLARKFKYFKRKVFYQNYIFGIVWKNVKTCENVYFLIFLHYLIFCRIFAE